MKALLAALFLCVVAPLLAEDSCAECHAALEGTLAKPASLFPQDVHAPLGGQGDLVKAVVKVAVDWK